MKEAYFSSEFYAESQSDLRVFHNHCRRSYDHVKPPTWAYIFHLDMLKNVWYVVSAKIAGNNISLLLPMAKALWSLLF